MTEITWRETEILIHTWRRRAKEMGYKKETKTYSKMEIEFFVGAFAMLAASNRTYPPIWNIIIMSGRSLSETLIPDNGTKPKAEGPQA